MPRRVGELDINEIEKHNKASKEEKKEMEKEILALKEFVHQLLKSQRQYVIPQAKKGNTLRIAACGDLHIGSLYERVDTFNSFVQLCEKEKVERILLVGDVLDGCRVYKGQEFELYANGLHSQLEAAKKKIIKTKLPIEFVCGNHDLSFKKLCGVAVGEAIVDVLGNNWRWVGNETSMIHFKVKNKFIDVALIHPSQTGSAYALSYRPQRIVESFTNGKPHMILIGHYHKAELMPKYRNVITVQTGCFEAQTPYMVNKGIQAHIGGWLLELTVGRNVNRLRSEFISYY